PTISLTGFYSTLYFVRAPASGSGTGQIYATVRSDVEDVSLPAEPIRELGSQYVDTHPTVRLDGLELFFSSTRSGGTVGIWTSTRASTDPTKWSAPIDVGAVINIPDASSPSISADGTELYFSSRRPGGHGGQDLYVTTRRRIQ
ncbi:MAG: hypothetical protein L0Z49_14505, partial [Actinobacteria bacterium]|nr:hypothetical protein [Actinomycetota bacterium]